MQQNDCIIDEKVNEFIASIKKHKSVLIVTLTINIIVLSFSFMVWYLYGHSLPELKDTDKLSVALDATGAIGSILSGIGTIVLVIFGYYGVLAYKNAQKQYLNQKKLDKAIDIVTEMYTQALNYSIKSHKIINESLKILHMYDAKKILGQTYNTELTLKNIENLLDFFKQVEVHLNAWVSQVEFINNILNEKYISDQIPDIKNQLFNRPKEALVNVEFYLITFKEWVKNNTNGINSIEVQKAILSANSIYGGHNQKGNIGIIDVILNLSTKVFNHKATLDKSTPNNT